MTKFVFAGARSNLFVFLFLIFSGSAHAQVSNLGPQLCILGPGYSEYKSRVLFETRLCNKTWDKCFEWTENRVPRASPKKVPSIAVGKSWTQRFIDEYNEKNLIKFQDTGFYWQIKFDFSFNEGMQYKNYNLGASNLYFSTNENYSCRRVKQEDYYHFRKKFTGIELYNGCNPRSTNCGQVQNCL